MYVCICAWISELLFINSHICVADIQEGGSKEQLWITVKSFIP